MTKTPLKTENIYCIGIGGTGLSAYARIMKNSGAAVSGSDEKESPLTVQLRAEEISVTIGHKKENLPETTTLVVYSPAIPPENPEREEAEKRGIQQLSYPQAVGKITEKFSTICICGTHGKTTTTAMAASAFIQAGVDPNVIVGASFKELDGKNERVGKGEHFILESCEYKRNFLNYKPQIALITNIEVDHLDYYKDLEDYVSAFDEFLKKVPETGLVIMNLDDPNSIKLIEKIKREKQKRIVTFGKSGESDYQLKNSSVFKGSKKITDLKLLIPGEHNLMNATGVVALCSELGFDTKKCSDALDKYTGSTRRFEQKGTIGKTVFIDDYAHHPTEIKVTLRAVREKFGTKAKVLCIFQPHQYSRTHKLLAGFITAFQDADEVIVPNILQVRDSEDEVKSINEEILVREMGKHHPNVHLGHGLDNTAEYVKTHLGEYDVILTMGAGDVWKIAEKVLKDQN